MSGSTRIRITVAITALLAGGAIAAASLAIAKSTTTLQTANNSSLGETLVVNGGGRTLYALSPETTHHLLCKSKTCRNFWPPLKVSKNAKLTAAPGIKGKLGKLHRNGFYQVTLGGKPLYTYGGDSKKGQANGNELKSFGGTWHVIAGPAQKHNPGTTSTTSTTTTTTTTMSTTTTTPIYSWG
jgi:predicted lipoprotein with Yx(FWY)xxD motif